MKNIFRAGKTIDRIFELVVLLKALFGFFEITAGILFAFSGKKVLDNFIISMAQQEISEDPNDIIANYLVNLINGFSLNSQIFTVAYLIFHGLANLFLVVSLFRNKINDYPWVVGFFSVFIIYQIYRYFHTYSLLLLALTVFDIFIASVIWIEYKRKKIRLNNQSLKIL